MHTFKFMTLLLLIAGASLFAEENAPRRPSSNGDWFLQSINVPRNIASKSTANKIVIAVVDDGMRVTHRDLKDFIWTNSAEIPDNNIDDDGNGYTDDTGGWDVADRDNTPTPPKGRSKDFYHGTHIAGIVAQIAQSAYGNSASEFIKIMPVKCLADMAIKTYLKDGYKGIEYAVKAGADIIICAWGVGHISADESEILRQAHDKGILIVASAGTFPEERGQYPAAADTVLAVAALDQADKKIERSNYGSFIDLSAPGVNISSTSVLSDAAHETREGSSTSTAMVAAAAGVIKLQHPSYSWQMVKACLKNSAMPLDALNPEYSAKLGAGKLNITAAVESTLFSTDTRRRNQLANPQGYLRFGNPDAKSTSWTIKPQGVFKGLWFKPLYTKGRPGQSTINFYSDDAPDAKLLHSYPLAALDDGVFVAGTSAHVTFEPKGADPQLEWLLEYKAESINFSTLYCSGTEYIEIEGTFDDGSADNDYSARCDCKWLITAPAGKVINIKFTEFDTEAKTDFVYFFDGAGTHEKIMAIFSGPNIPPELTTWRNQVLVWFVTDGKNQGAGWKAKCKFVDP